MRPQLRLTRLLPAFLTALAIFTGTAEGSVSPAERSLLNGVQVGQASLFRKFDTGFGGAFGNPPGAVQFRTGERSFVAALQRAGTRLLEQGTAARLSREAVRAERAWQTRSRALSMGGRASVFIHTLATAEIAFWRGIADAVRAHRTSAVPSSAQAAVNGVGAIFTARFQRAVELLLKGSRPSRAGRTMLLKLVGLGVRSFNASLSAGAKGLGTTKSAPNDQIPSPSPAPPSAPPPTPSTTLPQAVRLTLHCPASAHVNEALTISGTLAPVPEGTNVELLYYPPPYAGVESTPILKQRPIAAGGEFSDASVTPQAEGGGEKGSLAGTWIVEARYGGSALYSPPLPNQCDIQVEP